MNKKQAGKLIVLTGFSAAGKDTLMNLLLKKRPGISRIITHTTRAIRSGEKGGNDYHFVSTTLFEKMIKNDDFIEHVIYGSHYKGTSRAEFQRIFNGDNLVWRIDMSRAAIIEKTFTNKFPGKISKILIERTVKFLIKTTNPHISLSRYQKREGENANVKEFKKRLNQDVAVWLKYKHKFPNIIENKTGKQKAALKQILSIVDGVTT